MLNELVPIVYSPGRPPAVSAETLSRKLELDSAIRQEWWETILRSGLYTRGVDYWLLDGVLMITLNMAKHAALMVNTPVGRQIRQYFIDLETRLNRQPISSVRARAMLNLDNVPDGYFSVIGESTWLIDRVYAKHNLELSPSIQYDISIGQTFSKHIKDRYPNPEEVRVRYRHDFADARGIREAFAYKEHLLGEFRIFVRTVWVPKHAARNFSRDPKFWRAFIHTNNLIAQ